LPESRRGGVAALIVAQMLGMLAALGIVRRIW
jgi:hypothetical protein